MTNQNIETRIERGHRMLDRIDGSAGQAVIGSLADIAADFATYPSTRSRTSTPNSGAGLDLISLDLRL
ncbi:hypothetical protein [Nitratireductor thuwali]|uniref:Uncharacterized protein n=1 Tax=Nitratireductor thuwali TaxID=2267699 RepID=A0ABY5MFF4_9HYPH|nr:hypothetical protein NTH_00969 [Nitratireductor thuwali]